MKMHVLDLVPSPHGIPGWDLEGQIAQGMNPHLQAPLANTKGLHSSHIFVLSIAHGMSQRKILGDIFTHDLYTFPTDPRVSQVGQI